LLLPKKQKKGFPDFISKTDETRIQNMPFVLKNKDTKYIAREKIDGQSGTFFLKKLGKKYFWQKQNYDFGVCSRNLRLWNEDSSTYWFVAKKYNIKSILENLIGNNDFVAIQGECVAPNVQGNKYKVKEPDLYAFNLIYPDRKVLCLEAEEIFKQYGLKWCPLVSKDFTLPDTANELLDFATGKSALYDTLREGIVLRNYEKNISFKAVSPEFLIKNDE
jgi:RNA ligase (TIGR02306 family)